MLLLVLLFLLLVFLFFSFFFFSTSPFFSSVVTCSSSSSSSFPVPASRSFLAQLMRVLFSLFFSALPGGQTFSPRKLFIHIADAEIDEAKRKRKKERARENSRRNKRATTKKRALCSSLRLVIHRLVCLSRYPQLYPPSKERPDEETPGERKRRKMRTLVASTAVRQAVMPSLEFFTAKATLNGQTADQYHEQQRAPGMTPRMDTHTYSATPRGSIRHDVPSHQSYRDTSGTNHTRQVAPAGPGGVGLQSRAAAAPARQPRQPSPPVNSTPSLPCSHCWVGSKHLGAASLLVRFRPNRTRCLIDCLAS